jgi:hypothetical protein
MELKTEQVEARVHAREIFQQHHARYEVSRYFVLLDVRTVGVPPTDRKIHAGFDVDVYGYFDDHGSTLSFENGEPRETLKELYAACQVAAGQAVGDSRIELIADDATLVLDVHMHSEPEALVRIRITHSRGLDQPAGASEERALDGVLRSLKSLGVDKR